MNRRTFGWIGLAISCFGVLGAVSGCSDETRQTGTVVQTPSEDLKSREASAAAYRAMSKGSQPVTPK